MSAVTLNIRPLLKFDRAVMAGLKGGAQSNEIRRGFKQMAVVFRAWAKERFSTFSRGGGDWAALKPSTVARRKKGKARKLSMTRGGKTRTKTVSAGTVSILYDTKTLFGGLDPTFNPSKGAMQKDIPFGIRVGFGGAARHPKGKGASIADIAGFHQAGNTNMRPREIVVVPPLSKQNEFARILEDALGGAWGKATA